MTPAEAREILERFREEHIDKNERIVSTAWGPDPDSEGNFCILVYVYTDNKFVRNTRVEELEEFLPSEYGGLPVHVEGREVPVLF